MRIVILKMYAGKKKQTNTIPLCREERTPVGLRWKCKCKEAEALASVRVVPKEIGSGGIDVNCVLANIAMQRDGKIFKAKTSSVNCKTMVCNVAFPEANKKKAIDP